MLLLALCACSDALLTGKVVMEDETSDPTDGVVDLAPTCVITSPSADEVLAEGQVQVQAAVTDDAGVDLLVLGWELDGVAVAKCPTATVASAVSCAFDLGAGGHALCLDATDGAGQSARDCVSVTVEACVPSLWYRDADEDGYGDPEVVLSACEPPVGYVADATDCDDTDPGPPLVGSSRGCAGDSCAAVLAERPDAGDGSYWVDTDRDGDTSDAFEAWCDMTRDDGGWTLVQVGLDDGSNDLNDDAAVGRLDGPTPAASAKLARATIAEIAGNGTGELRYGHDDFGWLFLFDLDPEWVEAGVGSTGYGTFVVGYTSDVTYGGGGHPGSRFAWPPGGVPEVCPNVDGSSDECGAGLHYGTWQAVYWDGVYMNYSTRVSGILNHAHYLLWAR